MALLGALHKRGYDFVTPTPATHARVVARPDNVVARTLRDVFGWSLPFQTGTLDPEIIELLRAGSLLQAHDDLFTSKARVSTLDGDCFLHAAYPTDATDAVFWGPDSYRFAAFVRANLARVPRVARVVDVGAGAGPGASVAMKTPGVEHVTATDINLSALAYLGANLAGVRARSRTAAMAVVDGVESDGLQNVQGHIDCIIANPPYIADRMGRTYRDGGGLHGEGLSVRWAREAATRLGSGGALLLYSGSAIVQGRDQLKAALEEVLGDFDIRYDELDPDVFGEELESPAYSDVERIAVVGVVAIKR